MYVVPDLGLVLRRNTKGADEHGLLSCPRIVQNLWTERGPHTSAHAELAGLHAAALA
jgi:hypothetical protein